MSIRSPTPGWDCEPYLESICYIIVTAWYVPRQRIRRTEAPHSLCCLSWMLPLIPLLALIFAFGLGKHLHTHAIPLHSDPYFVHMLYTIVMWIPNFWLNFGSNFICAYQCHSWWQRMVEAYTQVNVVVRGHENSAELYSHFSYDWPNCQPEGQRFHH